MRVLVCGGRNLDYAIVARWLHEKAAAALGGCPISVIIHGGARGADEGASYWAANELIPVETFHPDWGSHGRAAGPIRNAKMIREGKPDVVIAFPGGAGTADCVRRAEAAGIPIVRPSPSSQEEG